LTNSKEAQEKIYSSFADKKITLSKDQAKAVSDRSLAVWSAQQKATLGSKGDATQLRIALGTEIRALRDQRDKGVDFGEAEAAQLRQLENEFRNLTNVLAGRVGTGGGGNGTVAGSSTLPAGFKLD
jgi:cobalamin biosynthesis Mg chelatase CobN